MLEIHGNLWDFHSKGHFIGITTNGDINSRGQAVMGRGIAKQAATRYPDLPYQLAKLIKTTGATSVVHPFFAERFVSIQVKYHWNEQADLALIENSCRELVYYLGIWHFPKLYLPRPGCGNGGLDWAIVRPAIAPILDNRFTIVEWR